MLRNATRAFSRGPWSEMLGLRGFRASNASGAPDHGRGRITLGVVVVLTALVGIIAFAVGRSVATPGQEAARARPPRPSVLTAPVQLTRARATVVLRGTLADGGSLSLDGPEDLGGDLPVVTAVGANQGSRVGSGDLIAAVAGRPVFVMPGQIPAFSPLSFGTTNVNVTELQTALAALGYSTAPDPSGSYQAGTAAAVAAFYKNAGYAPELSSPIPASHHRGARPTSYAEVPLGEIQFAPDLPVDVVAARRVGETLPTAKWLAKLGSGKLSFDVRANSNTASLLGLGASGRAVSDLNGRSFAIRLAAKKAAGSTVTLVLTPLSSLTAAAFVGQNMALRVSTGSAPGLQWVVPQAAVVTNASGASSVTVVRDAREVQVRVAPGLAYSGSEIVRPLHGGLYRGASVVVGVRP